MDKHDLDHLLSESLEVPDDGFTEQLMQALPPESLSLVSKTQLGLWLGTAVVVLAMAILGSVGTSLVSLTSGGTLALLLVSCALLVAHLHPAGRDDLLN